MLDAIDEVTAQHNSFEVSFGVQTQEFGGEPAQPVTDGREELLALHLDIYQTLGTYGCRFVDDTYMGMGYNPHSSGKEVIPGDQMVGIWTVMVIAKYPKASTRLTARTKQIEEAFRLRQGTSL